MGQGQLHQLLTLYQKGRGRTHPNLTTPESDKSLDDYTHIAVFSHISVADFLTARGFVVFETRPRFLPLTVKSRLTVAPWLIRAYLTSPIKPLAKQMLLRARVSRPCPEMKDHLSALHSHQQDPY